MATGTKICRVCGKEYACCGGSRQNTDGVFRYKDVACSPECGAIYLAEINKSRGITDDVKVVNDEVISTAKQADIEKKPVSMKSKKRIADIDDSEPTFFGIEE